MSNKKEITKIIPLFAALFALLVAVPLRIYQCRTLIDASTGFYNEINISVYILYIVIGLGGLIGLIVPFLKHNTLKATPISVKSVGFTVVSLLFAVLLIVDSASQLLDYFDLYSTGIIYNTTIKEYIASQGGSLLLMQAIFGALAAVYFFVNGVTVGLGNADTSKFRFISLLPVLWCIFKLLYRFKRTISFVNVSDLLFELFFIVFSMMFFFAAAQINSKIDINDKGSDFMKSVYWKIFGYGIPAALFALICFLPRFILLITGHSDNINVHYPVNYSDFGFAVFAVYTCITALKADNAPSQD